MNSSNNPLVLANSIETAHGPDQLQPLILRGDVMLECNIQATTENFGHVTDHGAFVSAGYRGNYLAASRRMMS